MESFYKGFDLISKTDIPDCESCGLYLRHRRTGLEVFHLLNKDKENLFAFAFRTPASDSSGAPHILEHSVLCGSEKYPLKEPFVNLMNQSVSTFLNALTYPDKTVYPASSMNRADYFNLMDVYGDAVFFPLLKEETFHQEGHRIEADDKGKLSIQGVVYNEMKGCFSSFDSVAFDSQFRSLFPGTCYVCDSGGDPLDIPLFTYDRFKSFHHAYYSPANCLLFLYGCIPTEEQLDFIQESILDRLEKIYPVPASARSYPSVDESYARLETPSPFLHPVVIHAKGPDSGVKKSSVTLNWRYGKSCSIDDTMENIFLMQVLAGNDSSPVAKALTDSRLGDRLLAGGGAEASMQMMYFGLSGVNEGDAQKVKDLITETLEKLCRDGVSSDDTEAAVLSVDFANREVVRVHGEPFSIVLMDRVLNAWNYGAQPASMLSYRTAFDKVKDHLAADKKYLEHLIKTILLDNTACSFVTVTPDTSFLEDRNRREAALVDSLACHTDRAQLKKDADLFHAYQQHKETEAEASCIPHIRPADLTPCVEPIETEVTSCPGADGSSVPLFISREPTDGIVYLDVCCPADVLPAQDYPLLTLFASCALNTGWNGKGWAQCSSEAALCCGDIAAHVMAARPCRSVYAQKAAAAAHDANYIGRDMVDFRIKLPVEKTGQALGLFAEALTCMEFSDTERIKMLLDELRDGMRSSVLPAGSRYAASRAARCLSRTKAVEEILSGLSQLFTLESASSGGCVVLKKRFADMLSRILGAGAVVHVTADSVSMQTALPAVREFAVAAGLHSLCAAPVRDDDAFYELTRLPGEDGQPRMESCMLPSQVGYAAQAVPCGALSFEEYGALDVLCHWMRNSVLWEKIRTSGGAYGADASVDMRSCLFSLTTYRDPSPLLSVKRFSECLDAACAGDLSSGDVSRAVTGCYGEEVQPLAPSVRGYVGFRHKLNAVTEDDRNSEIQAVLSADRDAIRKAACRMRELSGNAYSAVICDKSEKNTGVIIDLPV